MSTSVNRREKLGTRMMLRLQKFVSGRRTLSSSSLDRLREESNDLRENRIGETGATIGEVRSGVIGRDEEIVENDDVWRQRIFKRGITKLALRWKRLNEIVGFLFWLYSRTDYPPRAKLEALRLRRELKSVELAEIREAEEQRKLNDFHVAQAKIAEQTIINTLANLGHRNSNPKAKIKNVSFDIIEVSPNSYRFHVDARKLPEGVNLPALTEPSVTTTIAGALMRPVNAILGDPLTKDLGSVARYEGLWYEVEIAGSLSVPNRCEFRDMLEFIDDDAHPLSFTLGYGENKRALTRSLDPLPHLLISGETQGGKSNGMNVIICSILSRNTPNTIRTLMIDVKGGGIELGHYEGIKHMILDVPEVPNGIARNPEEGLAVLQWVTQESDDRMAEFTRHKIKKLAEWNKAHPNKAKPWIVVFIDELAELLDPEDRTLRKAVLKLIRRLASTSRAAGVHIVAALQTADRTNMPQTIKNNFPGRLAFAMSDASASILAVGDGSATNLSPVGRAIWKHGRHKFLCQTPLITNGDIAQVVAKAQAGETVKFIKRTEVTPEEIIRWAVSENEMSVSTRDVYDQFSDRMSSWEAARVLERMDGKTYEVDFATYRIIPGAGRRSRIVEKVHDAITEDGLQQTQTQTQPETKEQ